MLVRTGVFHALTGLTAYAHRVDRLPEGQPQLRASPGSIQGTSPSRGSTSSRRGDPGAGGAPTTSPMRNSTCSANTTDLKLTTNETLLI